MTTADAPHTRGSAFARARRGFRRWRRARPFWGGLLMVLSGIEYYVTAHLDLTPMHIQFGPEGFLTWVIPVMLLLCGVLLWLTPAQRIFYGVVGAAVAVYGLIGLNIGGFFIGMLLGIVGGALGASWTSVATAPAGEPGPTEDDGGYPEDPDATMDDILSGPLTDHLPTSTTSPLGVPPARSPVGYPGTPAAQPRHSASDEAAPANGANGPPGEQPPGGQLPRRSPRMFALILVATAVATAGLMASQRPLPAAAACPAVTPTSAAGQKTASGTPTPSGGAASKPAGPSAKARAGPVPGGTPAPAASSSAPPASGGGNQGGGGLLGGIISGLGRLLGVPPGPAPAPPAAPPAPAAAPSPSLSPTKPPSKAPATGPTGTPKPTATGKATKGAKPNPTPLLLQQVQQGCPAVGTRAAAVPADQPRVSDTPGKQIAALLKQSGLSYDGIAEVPTKSGTIRALKFSMSSSSSIPFELQIPSPGGHTISIKSSDLTVSGNVTFYTTEIKGNLLGLLPVDFTPNSPPPLVIPELFFTDATVQLVFVQSDVLTAPGFNLSFIR